MDFLKFFIVWVGSNLAVPFWVVGHVHLTVNVYEDIHEIIASFGMNFLVLIAFWLEWKKHGKKKQKSSYNQKKNNTFNKKTKIWRI
jgi:hypothetical protein